MPVFIRKSKSEMRNLEKWLNVLRLRNAIRFQKTASFNEQRQTIRFSQPTNDRVSVELLKFGICFGFRASNFGFGGVVL